MNNQWIFIVGLFAVIITVAIVVAIVNNYLEKKRTVAFEALAAELSFEFFPTGAPGMTTQVGGFHLFNLGRNRTIKNHLRGVAGGVELNIFDYRYVIGHGKHQQTISQSVFVARSEGMNLPLFSMRPETIWHKLGNIFGLSDIDFKSHPTFSSRYLLKGPDEAAIRVVFRPEILDYFEAHQGLNIEGLGDLLLYSTYRRLKPDKIRDFMTAGFEILKLFQSSGGENVPTAEEA